LRLGRFVRVIQLARVLRLGVLVRFLVELDRVVRDVRRIAMRNSVHVFLIVAASLAVIGGTLVWELERGSNPSFHNFGDAIWWAFATMTTVGYGNGPVTLAGRVIAAIVMIVGIGCFGVVTATVTAYFVQHPGHSDGNRPSSDELIAVLEDIRARLARLEQASAAGASVEEDLATLAPVRDQQHATP
jgi:voltage-gated potassium channel